MFRPSNFYLDHYHAYIQFAVKKQQLLSVVLTLSSLRGGVNGSYYGCTPSGTGILHVHWGCSKRKYSTTDQSGHCKTLILHMVKINVVWGHLMLSPQMLPSMDCSLESQFTIHWQLRNLKPGDTNGILSSEILEICFGQMFYEDVSIPAPFTNHLVL